LDCTFRKPDEPDMKLICHQCSFLVQILTAFSVINALFALLRTKEYRLFHSDVKAPISAPSARRVKVDSSPAASSPLRYLSGIIAPATDADLQNEEAPDVWELSVWDPLPVCLRLFVLFSPGHVLIVRLFLPYSAQDARPSVTVTQTLLLCALLSLQGHFLQRRFSQQSKDTTRIHSEVSKEYDYKFVHPNAHRGPVRDVGTQAPHSKPIWDENRGEWTAVPEVVSGKPYVSPRGFRIMPNSAYARQYDPNDFLNAAAATDVVKRFKTPDIQSHPTHLSTGPAFSDDLSSPIRSPTSARLFPSPKRAQYSSAATGTGDGGSLGVYSHAASPLRKAASANLLRHASANDARRREGSPLKRTSTPAGGLHQRLANARDDDLPRQEPRF
jgi:hypothetical protein